MEDVSINSETLKKVLSNPQINGFVSYEEQYYILDTLLYLGFNPFNESVLHFGSGNGEFVRYAYSRLPEQQRQVSKLVGYHGIDIRKDVVDVANEIYKDVENVDFSNSNLEDIESNSYDWSISPHYFIYKDDSKNNETRWNRINTSIKELYRISKNGVMITLLADTGDLQEEEKESVHLVNKEKTYSELQKITNNITIIDNYSDLEYTIILHKK